MRIIGQAITPGGGGGGELTIVGGTSRPSNVKDNAVWVNTDADITNYHLSASEPENPAEGTLWVALTDESNAEMAVPIGDDWMTICISRASLYTNGDWQNLDSQMYVNGEWRSPELLLYERGFFYNEDVIPILSNGALFNTDHINLQYQSGTNVRGIYTQTAPPPSGYSKVHMIVRVDIADSANHTTQVQYGQNALTASLPSVVSSGSGRVSYESATIPKTETEITINITGAYGFFIGCTNTGRSAYVYKIWLT